MATNSSKLLSRKKSALEHSSMSQAEVERATSTSVQAGLEFLSLRRDTLDGDEPSVRIRNLTGPVTPSAEVKTWHKTSGHAPYRRWCRWCTAVRTADEPHLREQQPEKDEAASRVELDSAELEREEDQTSTASSLNPFDDESESSTATLCSTKAFSDRNNSGISGGSRTQCGDATLRPSTCVGAVVENCKEQTSYPNVGETWSKNESSEPEHN